MTEILAALAMTFGVVVALGGGFLVVALMFDRWL